MTLRKLFFKSFENFKIIIKVDVFQKKIFIIYFLQNFFKGFTKFFFEINILLDMNYHEL